MEGCGARVRRWRGLYSINNNRPTQACPDGRFFLTLSISEGALIPLAILREAVVNAVVHADYSQKGAPIRISFFDDRIEIENPGILLPGLTMDDIRQGVSKLRNRVIARVFRELDLIEQWGSGIRRIFEEAQQLGLPEPQMVEIGMRVRFIVFLNEVVSVTTPEVNAEVNAEVTTEVNAEVKSVIEHLSDELTRRELQEKLGLKHDEYFRKAYLIPSLESGCIETHISH